MDDSGSIGEHGNEPIVEKSTPQNHVKAEEASVAHDTKEEVVEAHDMPIVPDAIPVDVTPARVPAENSTTEPHVQVDLTCKWEIAAITNFASLFEKLWHFPQIFAEDIEDGCNALCEDLASQFFVDFFIALLQSFRKSVEINRYNYQIYLSRIAAETGKGEMLARFVDQNFWALSAISRMELLLALCHARIDVDVNSPESKVKDVEPGSIRIEPLGEDSDGNTYWHFGDTRLYRDIPPPPPAKKKPATPKKTKRKGRGKRGKRKSPTKAATSKSDNTANDSVVSQELAVEPPPSPTARWELVCSTEDQWQTFFANLASSQKKNDVELFHVMSERIVPFLQDLFAEKERLLKKRVLLMAPRRQSYRLEEKRKAFVDAGRFISYIASDGQIIDGNDQEAEPACQGTEDSTGAYDQATPENPKRKFRRPPMTNEEALEKRRKLQEELELNRQKAASARANRANRRAEGLPAMCLSDEEGSHEEYELEEDSEEDPEMDFYRMEDILANLKKHQDAPPFIEPVPIAIAPDYYEIVKHPMDLNTMSRKVMQRQYANINELVADFDQLCQNCILYNGAQNPYSIQARRLSRNFQSLLRQNFPQTARERADCGFVGQMVQQKPRPQKRQPSRRVRRESSFTDADTTTSEAGLELTFSESASPERLWEGGASDPDWSPRQDFLDEDTPQSSKKKRARGRHVDGAGMHGYSQLCNNLDELLGADVDDQIAGCAVNEMASIRAKGSSRRASLPIQPKTRDFLTGYNQAQRSQPLPRQPRQQRFPQSGPRTKHHHKNGGNVIGNTMAIPNQHMHEYSLQSQQQQQQLLLQQQRQSQQHPRFASPTQPTAVLKQTPAGAYFRPTIGDLPPPVRRVTVSLNNATPSSSSNNNSNGSGFALRNLLVSSASGGSATNATTSTTTSSTPIVQPVKYKLVAAARPGAVAHHHQQQQQQQQQQQPLAYVMPISLAQSSTSGNTTVYLVQPAQGVPVTGQSQFQTASPVQQQAQPQQQISLARISQVQQQAQQLHQQKAATETMGNSCDNSTAVESAGTATSGATCSLEQTLTTSPSSVPRPPQQHTFSNAFLKFVSSSSARV